VNTRTLPSVILFSAAALLLAGCTGSISFTVPASTIADKAEDALEEEIGSRPSIDCGDEKAVKVLNTTSLDCTLTDPATDLEYDVEVSISDVNGTKYVVNALVANEANNAPESEETPTEGEEGAPLVYAYELAETAAGALTEQLGAKPTITCEDSGQIAIAVGFAIDCDIVNAKTGEKGIATITVTAIDGLKYSIDVKTKSA